MPEILWRRSYLRYFLLSAIMSATLTSFSFSQEEEEAEVEEEQPWNLSIDANYLSRYTRFGVDLSQNEPAVSLEAVLLHSSGLSAGIAAIGLTGENGGYEESSFHLGYERQLMNALTLSGTYTYHLYRNDSLNALTGISNTLTLGAAVMVKGVRLSASYNLYFGGASANYFSGGLSTTGVIGDLTIQPALEASIVSQEVDISLLPKNRGKGKGLSKKPGVATTSVVTTETIRGLSNFRAVLTMSYPLGKGFTVSLAPAWEYSPSDLGGTTSQFIVTVGAGYSVDF
ncbi:MAG: hypothetical protein WB699_11315 [Bacteroidota bacterium]